MDKEELYNSGLLEMYVLGLTDEDESTQVEALAAEHPDIRQQIDTMRKALEQYAISHSIPPPPELRDKVLSSVEDDIRHSGQGPGGSALRTVPAWRRWTSLAAGFILLASSLYFFQQHRRSEGRLTALKKDFVALERDCSQERQKLETARQAIAFIQKETTQPLVLSGSRLAPQAFATAFWNEKEQKVLLCTNGLPGPPPGKQYQAWADVDGEMISMGLVDRNDNPSSFHQVDYIPEAESVNITLEPEGGSTKPTVALLYANAAMPR